MKPKIVVLDGHTLNPGDISWEPVEQLGALTVYDRSGPLVVERACGAPIVLTNKEVISEETMRQLPELRYIGVLATGTNVVDLKAATRNGIVVCNVPGYGAPSVSQHTFALVLALTNHVARHAEAVRGGLWAECPDFSLTLAPLTELSGKTLGLVGVGAIGSRVAQIGSQFGMRIAAARQPNWQDVAVPGVDISWLALDELFAAADVLTLHCPLTDETHHLVNRRRLQQMKPTSILINTSRGPLVDEDALAEALCEGRIAGAAVDVLSVEPPRTDNPLIQAPHCLVTPHIAWATIEARQRLLQVTADNIRAFLEGQPQNVVDEAGTSAPKAQC